MNYRANQLRMQHRQNLAKLEQNWALERHQFQQDILNLQNSTDAKILENLEQDLKKKQDLLNQTINLLGASEIKSLTDLETLLEGKTLKELKESHSQELETKIANRNAEINSLAQKLNHTKERLQFFTENLKTKEGIITEYQQEIKAQEQNLATLQKAKEKLAKRKEQLEQDLNHNLSLKEAKISTLETNLLNLAKQKLTNQKQSRALVEQIEKEWKEKQQQWETQAQNQQEYAAQTLAQTKQEHSEEIKQLKTKHQQAFQQEKAQAEQKLQEAQEVFNNYRTEKENEVSDLQREIQAKQTKIQELEAWSQGQHNRITELETQASIRELKLETSTRELTEKESEWGREKQALTQAKAQELQEQKTFYQQQLEAKDQQNQTEKQTITNLNQQNQAKQQQLDLLNQTIQQNNQRITHLEEYLRTSQQDNQTKQQTITTLNQDKITLQQQITQLTQQQTENTRTLARQRQTLTQLLANREEELTNYKLAYFQAWLEADPSRKENNTFASFHHRVKNDTQLQELIQEAEQSTNLDSSTGWGPYYRIVLKWKALIEEPIQSEITLLKGILENSHDQ